MLCRAPVAAVLATLLATVPMAAHATKAPTVALRSLADLPTPLPYPYDEKADAEADVAAAIKRAKAGARRTDVTKLTGEVSGTLSLSSLEELSLDTVLAEVGKTMAAEVLARGPFEDATGLIRTRGIKLYMDGALGSRGAALFEPYADAPATTGLVRTPLTQALYDIPATKAGTVTQVLIENGQPIEFDQPLIVIG